MEFNELKKIVSESENIVFFGGAGTSTESGIPDFRSADGLYRTRNGGKYAPEQMLSRDFFYSRTELFFDFYKSNMIHPDAKPNAAHIALAELERQGRLKAVITQNIDGLHQLAGSRNVLELHGSVQRNNCIRCGTFHSLEDILSPEQGLVPACKQCGGIVKPDVVLYQEPLDLELLQRAADYIEQADVLVVAGTSLTVQPAAGLVRRYNGNRFILINKTPTPYDGYANVLVPDSIAKVMQALVLD
ncbi:NAD-dependent protein deacylase [Paenibacillus thermoaerophilus]|uniref:NAD-dependent protein deacetylase n=1 Tax=Paenibacillus thermoaerophilus TaxID=1215385 RepID=A0ABW2UX70_9BACL|nr:NAD-dependent protein deacylase [Paenibacillus thermoaerophilus]TMV17368.1 NAD-dependent protein deacylase [Paenibacillus thermoaerophilus]